MYLIFCKHKRLGIIFQATDFVEFYNKNYIYWLVIVKCYIDLFWLKLRGDLPCNRVSVSLFSVGVNQKVRSLKTSSFWHPSPLVRFCSFYMYPPPSQRKFALVSYPPSKKLRPRLWRLFQIKNRRGKGGVGRGGKREKNLSMKDQCFLHSYIYNDNAKIYKFIKKR